MRIYPHFNPAGQTNSYLITPDQGGGIIIIDPSEVDRELIELIESHHFVPKAVLLTHSHKRHTGGLGTLMKIYSPDIYAFASEIEGFATIQLTDGDKRNIAGFEIEAIRVPGHSLDSLVYKCGNALFTGDVLAAGRVGTTRNMLANALLIKNIQERLMILGDNNLVFPGHGAVSKLRIERMFNHDLLESEVTLLGLPQQEPGRKSSQGQEQKTSSAHL